MQRSAKNAVKKVSTSQTMSVSTSYTAKDTGNFAYLQVLVFTGASTTDPIGASGGNRKDKSTITDTYTSTTDNSWDWLLLQRLEFANSQCTSR